jgi:hypothetical protein
MATIHDLTTDRKAAARRYDTPDGDLDGIATRVAEGDALRDVTDAELTRRVQHLRPEVQDLVDQARTSRGSGVTRGQDHRDTRQACGCAVCQACPWTRRMPGVYFPSRGLAWAPTEAPRPGKEQGRLCWAVSPCLDSSWVASADAGWACASCCTGWCPPSIAGWRRSVAS